MKFSTLAMAAFALFISGYQVKAGPIDEGRSIFAVKCMTCHKIDKDSTGPALAGVENRHSMEWIINFVRSPSEIIKSGDPDAKSLFLKFNRTVMPDHGELTNTDVINLVAYIQFQTKQIASPAAAPKENSVPAMAGNKRDSFQRTGFIISFIIVTCTLILVLFFAAHIRRLERKMHGKD